MLTFWRPCWAPTARAFRAFRVNAGLFFLCRTKLRPGSCSGGWHVGTGGSAQGPRTVQGSVSVPLGEAVTHTEQQDNLPQLVPLKRY